MVKVVESSPLQINAALVDVQNQIANNLAILTTQIDKLTKRLDLIVQANNLKEK